MNNKQIIDSEGWYVRRDDVVVFVRKELQDSVSGFPWKAKDILVGDFYYLDNGMIMETENSNDIIRKADIKIVGEDV